MMAEDGAQPAARRSPEDLLGDPHSHAASDGGAERDPRHPWQVRVHPLGRLFVWAVGLVVVLWFFKAITYVVLLLLAAGALAALLRPVAKRLPGPKWVRGTLAGAGFVVLFLALASLLVWLLSGAVREQVNQWPQIRQSLNDGIQNIAGRFGIENAPSVQQIADQAITWLTSGQQDVLTQVAGSLGIILVALLLFVFGAIYLLAEKNDGLVHGLERLFQDREYIIRGALGDLDTRLRWWLLGTLTSMLVAGTLQAIGYWAVGLNYALAIGIFAGLAEIVPTFGPAAAYLIALLVASTQGTQQVIGVTVIYLIVQAIESYVLVPLIMQGVVNLHPLITLFTIVLWGRVFGPLGLLLALPIDLTLWTLVDRFYLRRQRDPRAGPPAPDGADAHAEGQHPSSAFRTAGAEPEPGAPAARTP